MRVHLVYPMWPGSIVAPWSIGNYLLAALLHRGHVVSWQDWDDCRPPDGGPFDLLLGHPHPEPGRAYELACPNAGERVAISPWNGSDSCRATIQRFLDNKLAYRFLAICGPYWAAKLPPEWPATPVDMAADHTLWTVPNRGRDRYGRILNVGCTLPDKGSDYLRALSEAAPDLEFAHVGAGTVGGRVREFGFVPNGAWKELAHSHRVVVATGDHDANPTSLLEGALAGMLPVCLPTCGWGEDLAVHLTGDVASDANLLRLVSHSKVERVEVAKTYNWDRFLHTVLGAIE